MAEERKDGDPTEAEVDVGEPGGDGMTAVVSGEELRAWNGQVTDALVLVQTENAAAARQRQELDTRVSDLASRTAAFDVDMAVGEERYGELSAKVSDLAASVCAANTKSDALSVRVDQLASLVEQLSANIRDMLQAPATANRASSASWRSTADHAAKAAARDAEKAWKVLGSRKHWMLRGRMPQDLSASTTQDMQSLLGEKVQVDDAVASQLRSIASFDVRLYVPRGMNPTARELLIPDRLGILASVLTDMLRWGLDQTVNEDAACVKRVVKLGKTFEIAVNKFRSFCLMNYTTLEGAATTGILADMVNKDLRRWDAELSRLAQQYPSPPSGVPFPSSSFPGFQGLNEFTNSTGAVFSIVLQSTQQQQQQRRPLPVSPSPSRQ